MDVGIGSVNFKRQFCVAPTNGIKYDMLESDDFLKKNRVLVYIASRKLSSPLEEVPSNYVWVNNRSNSKKPGCLSNN